MAAISLVASIAPAIVNLALVSVSLNEAKVAFNRMFEFVGIPSEKKEGDFSREGWIAFKLRIFLSVFQDGKEF